jgi:nucleotide-binding universal stress UspA family protein
MAYNLNKVNTHCTQEMYGMKKIRRILTACDLSEYSPYIIGRVGQLSHALSASLTFVNVINQRDVNAFIRVLRLNAYSRKEIELEEYIGEEKEARIDKLEELIKDSGFSYLTPRIIIRSGIPVHEILKTVEQEDTDLLVIGTKGRGSFRGMLLGSTAEKIFRHCPVPLLSLRVPKVCSEATNKLTLPEFNYNYR